jgi:Cys-tRNA(Pro)/Cys-tRNA(Cys) deacylase
LTPAINMAKKAGVSHVVHSYSHDPNAASYGLEAAEKLGLDQGRVFKTLVVQLGDGSLAVAVLPVSSQLNMKRMAKACGAKRADMANTAAAERATGYVLGGISPLGQKRRLPTVIDASAQEWPTIYVSAGRRGLEIEIAPHDLLQLTRATYGQLRD